MYYLTDTVTIYWFAFRCCSKNSIHAAYEYLKVLRMNYALLLLRDSDDNIRNVVLKVDYRNAGHFSKLFKDTFGMGPKEYRNTHRIK